MATAAGRVLDGTRYREIIGADDPPGKAPLGDFINAGPGNDYLIGDIGADVFGFNPGDGQDYIDNFTPGEDKLQFGGGLTAASLSQQPASINGVSGLLISYPNPGGKDAVFLAGITALRPGDVEFQDLPGRYFDPPVDEFSGDSRSDLVLHRADGTLSLWAMTGAAPVETLLGKTVGGWTAVGIGDFNGSWTQDLLFQNQNGALSMWFMADTRFVKAVDLPNPGPQWHAVAAGHLDDDAAADIVLRNDDGGVSIWRMGDEHDPDGTVLSASLITNPGPAWTFAGLGDLDGDTRAEILMQHTNGTIVQWQTDGFKYLGGSPLGVLGTGASFAGTGDFNGDHKDEILIRQADGTLTEWSVQGGAVTAVADVGNPGATWKVAATGDYDGDGKSDIMLQNADGTLVEWLMNGATVAGTAPVGNPGADWHVV